MRKPAKVKFIGEQCYYKLGCDSSGYKYCKDCRMKNCSIDTPFNFIENKIYNAYFLEYWQGVRNSLHVKGEDGRIDDFIPLSDFEIIEDTDNVLNTKEAIVRCISHDCDDLFDVTYGKEYKAIGTDIYERYLIMDDSMDCYFYLSSMFEVVEDEYNILNPEGSLHVYDFDNFTE